MSEKYTIGDLAKRLNITTRMIRYYDQKDLVKPDSVSENGYRMYSIQQVRQLQLIIFLKGLGFSLNDVQKILNDHHRNNLLELLLEKQKNANQKEIEKLKKQNNKIDQLRMVLDRTNKIEEVTDITKLMDEKIQYKKLTRSLFKLTGEILTIEILGIGLVTYLFNKQMRLAANASIIILVLLMIGLSTIFLKSYYQKTAYFCPNCSHKFVPKLSKFMLASHTLHTRRLRCPNCHEKSYCLETVR